MITTLSGISSSVVTIQCLIKVPTRHGRHTSSSTGIIMTFINREDGDITDGRLGWLKTRPCH